MSKQKDAFPMSKLRWLWYNMKGTRVLFVFAIIGTLLYNVMQLTVPYFSAQIVDNFLTGEDARKNLTENTKLFYTLIILMVVVTVVRVILVYLDCMAYEYTSQKTLYRVRNFLYDKIQRQDMKFYSTYRTGDLMTRVTGDLDAVRHMVAWVTRMIVEAFSLYTATAVYLFIMNWKPLGHSSSSNTCSGNSTHKSSISLCGTFHEPQLITSTTSITTPSAYVAYSQGFPHHQSRADFFSTITTAFTISCFPYSSMVIRHTH